MFCPDKKPLHGMNEKLWKVSEYLKHVCTHQHRWTRCVSKPLNLPRTFAFQLWDFLYTLPTQGQTQSEQILREDSHDETPPCHIFYTEVAPCTQVQATENEAF